MPVSVMTVLLCCADVGAVDDNCQLTTVSLSRQERGLLKMRLTPQAVSSPAPLVIADMYGTNIAISNKLQVFSTN